MAGKVFLALPWRRTGQERNVSDIINSDTKRSGGFYLQEKSFWRPGEPKNRSRRDGENMKFYEELIVYFPLIRHGPHSLQ
jgi:hypothetical protein